MTSNDDWETTFEAEIEHAEEARRSGSEGMARVCARRAAGALVGAYFARSGIHLDSVSAYDRLRYLSEQPTISPEIVESVNLFLSRVTFEHTLPGDVDLIAEARCLRQELMEE